MLNNEEINLACSRALKVKSLNNHCSQACLCGIAPHIGLEFGVGAVKKDDEET